MAKQTFVCVQCGKEFIDYAQHERKYCSRACADKVREDIRTCKRCGTQFRHTQRGAFYCSRKCYHADRRESDAHNPQTCQQCGKTFVDPKHRNRRFCSQECSGKSKSILRMQTCAECGNSFESRELRKYCSKKCRLAAGWTPQDPTKHTTSMCAVCGKEFTTWSYRNAKCCSARCANTLVARHPKPSMRRPENFIERACQICGKPFKVHKCQLARGKNQGAYCSKECQWEAIAKHHIGEGNPYWKGGHVKYKDYGPNWYRVARKVRKLADYRCQSCGHKIKRRLTVHHIIPFKRFKGDWESANQLTNLVALCRPCHAAIEDGKKPLQLSLAHAGLADDHA